MSRSFLRHRRSPEITMPKIFPISIDREDRADVSLVDAELRQVREGSGEK